MPLIENVALRQPNSVTFQDDADNSKHRLISSLIPLHYDDGSGNMLRVDMSPVSVLVGTWAQFATFQGWRITTNGFHYALGEDGQIGFGGRGGEHWFWFRLLRVGYLDDPVGNPTLASDFHNISDAQPEPTYDTANLTRTVQTQTVDGENYTSRVLVEWRNLWTTPGGGELYLRFVIDGKRLKAEYIINGAGRDWIEANASPADKGIAAATAFFGFVFEVDWSDIPKRVLNGVEKLIDDDFDDADENLDRQRGLELQNAVGEVLGLMPADDVLVRGAGVAGGDARLRLRKRFWKDSDGKHYLGIGAPAPDIAALPAGDLVFDPTISETVGASDDNGRAQIEAGETEFLGAGGASIFHSFTAGGFEWVDVFARWPDVQFSGTPTSIDDAFVTIHYEFTGSDDVFLITFEDAADPGQFSDVADYAGRARTTASVSYDPSVIVVEGDYDTPSLVSIIEELVASHDYVTAPVAMIFYLDTDGAHLQENAMAGFDGDPAEAMQLTIDFTVAAGGLSIPVAMYSYRQRRI